MESQSSLAQKESEFWKLGYLAGLRKDNIDSNPFVIHTVAYKSWLAGWRDGMEENTIYKRIHGLLPLGACQ